jgi:hypothetical protein
VASFSVSLPWQSFVAARLPEMTSDITRQWPGISAVIVAGEGALFVQLEVDGPSPGAAAVAVARYLSPMWPGFLAECEVALGVECEGLSWRAPAALMVQLGEGVSSDSSWLADSSG